MTNLKLQIAATMVLGVLCLVAGLCSHLALTDIYHGEADTSLEWRVVRATTLIVLFFVGMTFFTLARVWRSLARASRSP